MTRVNRVIFALTLAGLLISSLGGTARSQTATIAKKTFTISGTTGLPGVTLQGFPGLVVTDENGVYSVEVPPNWRGAVVPVKVGYVFEPARREYASVDADRTRDDYKAVIIIFAISGSTGLPGVTMQGLPGDPVTDEQGRYSARVAYGWSGAVTPQREGYLFQPSFRQYSQVVINHGGQDYSARVVTFTISGSTGAPGVIMEGFPGEVVTDPEGRYRVTVPYGWAGRTAPKKVGFEFAPAARNYSPLRKDCLNEDYTAKVLSFTISGNVGVGDAFVKVLPGGPVVADSQGHYQVQVEYGWSGRIMPTKEGYTFIPEYQTYNSVVKDLPNQNFKAMPRTFTVSGRIWIQGIGVSSDVGVPGVTLLGFPGEPRTDEDGRYVATVEYGWSGAVVPRKESLKFEPASREYSKVIASQGEQNYIGAMKTVPDSAGDVLVIPTTGVVPEQLVQIIEDLRVMLRIFREKLSEPRMILGVLRDYGNFFGADRKVEALYLQGTAAMFVIEVDFPYSFPRQRPAEDQTQKEAVDPVWQRARERLYVPPGSGDYGASGRTGPAQEMTFDQFRDELLRSLKHAANLRHLDPNELVILTIVAQSEDAGWPGQATSGAAYSGRRADPYGSPGIYASTPNSRVPGVPVLGGQERPRGVPATTVLTMQAKKADIDAFARGDLDFEQFQAKVRAFTY